MRAKTENGPPIPVCWASMSWVRNRAFFCFHVFGSVVAPKQGGVVVSGQTDDCCSGVPGVWLEGSDGTDINALCRSHSERMVAVADDFCKVHLFQYPCPKPKVPLVYITLYSGGLYLQTFKCFLNIKPDMCESNWIQNLIPMRNRIL